MYIIYNIYYIISGFCQFTIMSSIRVDTCLVTCLCISLNEFGFLSEFRIKATEFIETATALEKNWTTLAQIWNVEIFSPVIQLFFLPIQDEKHVQILLLCRHVVLQRCGHFFGSKRSLFWVYVPEQNWNVLFSRKSQKIMFADFHSCSASEVLGTIPSLTWSG